MSTFQFILQPNYTYTAPDFISKNKGWFQFGYKNEIQLKIQTFIEHYNNHNFAILNNELYYLYKNSVVFFTTDNCIQTADIFMKLIKILKVYNKPSKT